MICGRLGATKSIALAGITTPFARDVGATVTLAMECRRKRVRRAGRLMGRKGNCAFLGARFGKSEMSVGARRGYGA